MTLLSEVVAASDEVASTSARTRKIARLAELLRALEPSEVDVVVGFLSGAPRQGKIGVGWSTVYKLELPPAAEPSLHVADLDSAINEIQQTVGTGSAGKRREILTDVMGRATAAEVDFIRRLFTGELRQGALEGVMVEAIARAGDIGSDVVRRALMLSGDLPGVAQSALTEGEPVLREVTFQIFRPVLPMLASTSADVAEAMSGFEESSVEWKLDGIRIQVHRKGDEVRIYTRNLNDITASLPGIVDAVRKLPAQRVVLDAEAIGMWGDVPASFQDTVSRIDSEAQPEGIVTFLFDMVHLDDEDLLDVPLRDRLDALQRLAPQLRIPGVRTSDVAEGERVLADALGAGHEGVVVKDASSLYIAGRRGKAWRKVKPVQTYDLVVLGAEWGHGRRKGWLSNLHLGARDPDTGEFVMVGKCFKGLTDELLDWQTKALLERETRREGIAVFVRPELVCEIALDGVQRSTRYPGGVAMRFARVRRYRPDKDARDADTIETLQKLLRRSTE